MTVAEAIVVQKEFIANKYDKNTTYPNYKLKESMKELTTAYENIWNYMSEYHQDILDQYLMSLPNEGDKRTFSKIKK